MRVRPTTRDTVAVVDVTLAGKVFRRPVVFDVTSRQWIVRADITIPGGTGPRLRRAATGRASGSSPATATLSGAPLAGNTLLAVVGSSTPRTNLTLSDLGYTLIPGGISDPAPPATRPISLNVWWKAADPADRSLTVTPVGANGTNVALLEYSNLNEASLLDAIVTAKDAADVETLAIGPTPTLAQANTLCLLVLDSIWGRTAPSASGGFLQVLENDQRRMVIFDRDPMATTAQSSVLTWDGAHYANALLLTLKADNPAAGNRNPTQETSEFVEFNIDDDPAPALPALPDAPLGLAGVPGQSSAGITWNGTGGATGYRLYENGVLVFEVVNYVFYSDSAVALTAIEGTLRQGLATGSYDYQVSGTNRSGEGPKSGVVTVVVSSDGPTLEVVEAAGTLDAATWSVVESDGTLVPVLGFEER